MATFKQVKEVKNKIKDEFILCSWWHGIAIEHNKKDGFFISIRVSRDAPKYEIEDKIRQENDVVIVIEEKDMAVAGED